MATLNIYYVPSSVLNTLHEMYSLSLKKRKPYEIDTVLSPF